jgi:transcriptional regulator with XRE-family HTH domain
MRVSVTIRAMELKKYRKIAGLTQEQLARTAGVDATIISRLERGIRQTASYVTIVRLARALNLEPEELLAVPAHTVEKLPRPRQRRRVRDAAL